MKPDISTPEPGGPAEFAVSGAAPCQGKMLVGKMFGRIRQIVQGGDGGGISGSDRPPVFSIGQAVKGFDLLQLIRYKVFNQI